MHMVVQSQQHDLRDILRLIRVASNPMRPRDHTYTNLLSEGLECSRTAATRPCGKFGELSIVVLAGEVQLHVGHRGRMPRIGATLRGASGPSLLRLCLRPARLDRRG